ncbi:TPA: hypothetical protein ACPSKE_000549 [Legionella feeleii]
MMNQKAGWDHWLTLIFKEFMGETQTKSRYEIINIYECKKTGFTKAVLEVSKCRTIEKNIRDIVVDKEFLNGLDKKTLCTLTYIATTEYLKPDYAIVSQQMIGKGNWVLEIRSKVDCKTIKKSPSEISKDKALIEKFNSVEANRIGYMAGISEAAKEYRALSRIAFDNN